MTGGGIFNSHTGTLFIYKSSFSANSASSKGSAIYNDKSGDTEITNSTFTGNYGGNATIYQQGANDGNGGGKLTINNVTISGNSNNGLEVGTRIWPLTPPTVNLRNTIIANNTTDCKLWPGASLTQNINNLIEDNSCSSSTNISGDPKPGSTGRLASLFPAI